MDFEFYTDATPGNAGTACCIYSSADFPSVPQDSYLITAYGKTKTGQQEKLSIQEMTVNSNYTEVLVAEPDAALDSLDTSDTPDSYAITVNKSEIDPNKWIVFVDSDGNILDIILPQDIAGISQTSAQPGASAQPAGTAAGSQGSPAATPTEVPADND